MAFDTVYFLSLRSAVLFHNFLFVTGDIGEDLRCVVFHLDKIENIELDPDLLVIFPDVV